LEGCRDLGFAQPRKTRHGGFSRLTLVSEEFRNPAKTARGFIARRVGCRKSLGRSRNDKSGSFFAAHQRQRRFSRMGAALGAARDMEGEGRVENIASLLRDFLGDFSRLDVAGSAGRRAGTGGYFRARVGGIGDEADRGGGASDLRASGIRKAEPAQGALRGDSDFRGAE
jgi:hypothetical protein